MKYLLAAILSIFVLFSQGISQANYSFIHNHNSYIFLTQEVPTDEGVIYASYILNVFNNSRLFIYYGLNCRHGFNRLNLHQIQIISLETPIDYSIEVMYNIDMVGYTIHAAATYDKQTRILSFTFDNNSVLDHSAAEIEYVSFRININGIDNTITFTNDSHVYQHFNSICELRYEEYTNTCLF